MVRLNTYIAGGTDLIPGQGTKIPEAEWYSQERKKKKRPNMSLSELATL